jgi:hypothetical protein
MIALSFHLPEALKLLPVFYFSPAILYSLLMKSLLHMIKIPVPVLLSEQNVYNQSLLFRYPIYL